VFVDDPIGPPAQRRVLLLVGYFLGKDADCHGNELDIGLVFDIRIGPKMATRAAVRMSTTVSISA
jgi:hypothetical protein